MLENVNLVETRKVCFPQKFYFSHSVYVLFHISDILGGSPFSNEADFQGALHLTTNNKFHKQLKVKDTT